MPTLTALIAAAIALCLSEAPVLRVLASCGRDGRGQEVGEVADKGM